MDKTEPLHVLALTLVVRGDQEAAEMFDQLDNLLNLPLVVDYTLNMLDDEDWPDE